MLPKLGFSSPKSRPIQIKTFRQQALFLDLDDRNLAAAAVKEPQPAIPLLAVVALGMSLGALSDYGFQVFDNYVFDDKPLKESLGDVDKASIGISAGLGAFGGSALRPALSQTTNIALKIHKSTKNTRYYLAKKIHPKIAHKFYYKSKYTNSKGILSNFKVYSNNKSHLPKNLKEELSIAEAITSKKNLENITPKKWDVKFFEGMKKLEFIHESLDGKKTVIHFIQSPKTNKIYQIKIKKRPKKGLTSKQ